MRSALATLPTTYQVGFDLDRDEVYVAYDAQAGTASTATAPMIEAVARAGFKPAWLKREGWPDTVEATVLTTRR